MGCFEIDRRGAIVVKRAFPARNTHAPRVAGLQSGKTPLRAWRDEVIAVQHGEIQKFLRDFHANRVLTHILRPCATETVTIKAGQIGRASCRERLYMPSGAEFLEYT